MQKRKVSSSEEAYKSRGMKPAKKAEPVGMPEPKKMPEPHELKKMSKK